MKKKHVLFILILITGLVFSGCNYYTVPTVSEEELAMNVAGTRSALATQSSVETMIVQLEELKKQPTCPVCPTCALPMTPTPSPTVPTMEEGSSVITITPIGDQNNANCLKFDYLGDVNYPPDTLMKPKEKFTKTWWVRNSGTCTWTTQFKLVVSGGEVFGSQGKVSFTQDVPPGETVELSIPDLVAPPTVGTYYSYWLIESPYGNRFGYGPNQQWGLGIKIIVTND